MALIEWRQEFETGIADVDHEHQELVELIEHFYRSPRRRFPVLDENQLVGLISRRDVLRAFLEMI